MAAQGCENDIVSWQGAKSSVRFRTCLFKLGQTITADKPDLIDIGQYPMEF